MNRSLLLLLLVLVGCDQEIKRVHVSSDQYQSSTSCDDGPAGFCYACGLTIAGKFECSMHYHFNCPGRRDVILEHDVSQITYRRRDGKTYTQPEARDTIVKYLDECH